MVAPESRRRSVPTACAVHAVLLILTTGLFASCVPTGDSGSDRGDDAGLDGGPVIIVFESDAGASPGQSTGTDATPGDADPPVDFAGPEPDPSEPEPDPSEPEPAAEPEPDPEPAPAPEPDPQPEPEPEPLPVDPHQRTAEQTCVRWRADHRPVDDGWTPTADGAACDPGTLTDAAQSNAIRRTNLYRWLAGLEPIALDPARVDRQQHCAALQAALGQLDHGPRPDAPCYTPAGAEGAGSSNLAFGVGVADSVDLYVADRGVASLGHRRWVLNPSATVTAFGWKARFSCMYSFSQSRAPEVRVVAWPPSGPVPTTAATGRFSVSLYGVAPGAGFAIAVGVDGASPAAVPFESLAGGFGGQVPAYAFDPAVPWRAGHRVQVVLSGLADGTTESWITELIDCP